MNATVAGGGTLTLIPRFDPGKALEIIERDRVNIFLGVPTMYGAILHHPDRERYDTSTLRLCGSGGSAMPVELMRGFEKAFDCKVLEGYGLSETSPVASFNHPDRERKPGSIGTPIEGVEMKVVDEHGQEVPQGEVGEIVIRGHNVMKGYWNRPDATAEAIRDGWFHTGDMATVDEDGYFFIVDRKKDMIIRGGYNVYPREIEEVLYEHPAVREAAVLGTPDDEYGEEVGAAVALKDGAQVSAEELREFVKEQVAAYKYPRRIWFVDELPKGPTGKILKREIAVPDGGERRPRHRADSPSRSERPRDPDSSRGGARRPADPRDDRRARDLRAAADQVTGTVQHARRCAVRQASVGGGADRRDATAMRRIRALPRQLLDLGMPARDLARGPVRPAPAPARGRRRGRCWASLRAVTIDRGCRAWNGTRSTGTSSRSSSTRIWARLESPTGICTGWMVTRYATWRARKQG